MYNWQQHLIECLQGVFTGSRVSNSWYDLAWLARIPNPVDAEHPLFPHFIDFLLINQGDDGSWQSKQSFPYISDKIVCTLSVVTALARWQNPKFAAAIASGVECVNRILPVLHRDRYRSVGFELIVPALIEEACDLGLVISISPELSQLTELGKKKLHSVTQSHLYQMPTTLLHSLEALYKLDIQWNSLDNLQDRNGAFLSSPAATAKFYLETGNRHALTYLQKLVDGTHTVPVNSPIDIFEMNWCLEVLERLGLKSHTGGLYQRGIAFIQQCWSEKGISWASTFALPDLDNTSVSFYLLRQEGLSPSPTVFENFIYNQDIYCFPAELDSSPTHLLHFLSATEGLPEMSSIREQVVEKIKCLFTLNGWYDKWHLSPYYTIALAVRPLLEAHPASVKEMLTFLIDTHRQGWGIGAEITLEETAWACYAIQQVIDRLGGLGDSGFMDSLSMTLDQGLAYLKAHYKPNCELPNLWIDKCLYTPHTIVHTVILSLLFQWELNASSPELLIPSTVESDD